MFLSRQWSSRYFHVIVCSGQCVFCNGVVVLVVVNTHLFGPCHVCPMSAGLLAIGKRGLAARGFSSSESGACVCFVVFLDATQYTACMLESGMHTSIHRTALFRCRSLHRQRCVV